MSPDKGTLRIKVTSAFFELASMRDYTKFLPIVRIHSQDKQEWSDKDKEAQERPPEEVQTDNYLSQTVSINETLELKLDDSDSEPLEDFRIELLVQLWEGPDDEFPARVALKSYDHYLDDLYQSSQGRRAIRPRDRAWSGVEKEITVYGRGDEAGNDLGKISVELEWCATAHVLDETRCTLSVRFHGLVVSRLCGRLKAAVCFFLRAGSPSRRRWTLASGLKRRDLKGLKRRELTETRPASRSCTRGGGCSGTSDRTRIRRSAMGGCCLCSRINSATARRPIAISLAVSGT